MYTVVNKSCHGNTGCNTGLSTVLRDWVFPRGIAVHLNGRSLVTQSGNELHTQPSAVTCDCLRTYRVPPHPLWVLFNGAPNCKII